jgi:hypothetical protein
MSMEELIRGRSMWVISGCMVVLLSEAQNVWATGDDDAVHRTEWRDFYSCCDERSGALRQAGESNPFLNRSARPHGRAAHQNAHHIARPQLGRSCVMFAYCE